MLLRNPCKNLKSYVMPFYGFNNVTKKREKKRKRKICKIVAYGCQTLSLQRRSDQKNFRSRRCGSSLPCLLTRHSRSAPHRHEGKFSGARVCRMALNHLPRLLRTHFKSSRKFQTFQKKIILNLKNPPLGPRWGTQCFWGVNIPFY